MRTAHDHFPFMSLSDSARQDWSLMKIKPSVGSHDRASPALYLLLQLVDVSGVIDEAGPAQAARYMLIYCSELLSSFSD